MAARKGHFGCLENGHDSFLQGLVEVSFLPLFAYAYALAYAYVVDLQQLPKREYSAQI